MPAASTPLLQKRTILTFYLCKVLGFSSFHHLRDVMRESEPGVADDGHTGFFHRLASQSGRQLSGEKLAEYDLRIQEYENRLNRYRVQRISLLYFQYIAVLFTEIFLDNLFHDEDGLQSSINLYVDELNNAMPPTQQIYDYVKRSDLRKIAFWMATGSGKTIIMHINIWQFLHYAGSEYDYNVLLITPYESLSRQHLEEFRKSGIRARHYNETGNTLLDYGDITVRVLEVTKLTDDKRGGGLSVDVDVFGSENLLLVDEGHRGARGDVWRNLRRQIASEGFTFEYSATFGQIVNGASTKDRSELLEEYSKSIILNYSYPYFYHDGYGKDYWITNLKDDSTELSPWMLLANLLSFYEQTLLYFENPETVRRFNIEKPLWVFVGHTVTSGTSRADQASLTDVEEIVSFLDSFLKSPELWIRKIEKLLQGDSGIKDTNEEDAFGDRFNSLREREMSARSVYYDIISRILNSETPRSVQAVEMKSARGEIGLRIGEGNPFFGVINIGDVAGLIERLQRNGIHCEDDNLNDSLFEDINNPSSNVNILIGSRKFMEGWDSFRVASMGLMNIGRGEGSQIIQLFGRGVRLHGKDHALKRSSVVAAGESTAELQKLETLNVFGVRANYMNKFRKYLEEEGIETFEEFKIPIQVQSELLNEGLQVLDIPSEKIFERNRCPVVGVDEKLHVKLDFRPRFETAKPGTTESKLAQTQSQAEGTEVSDVVRDLSELLNWHSIYGAIVAHTRMKNMYNISFDVDGLRRILEQGQFEIWVPEDFTPIDSFSKLRSVERVVISLLQKYISRFYDFRRREWESECYQFASLSEEAANVNWGSDDRGTVYTVKVPSSENDMVERIQETLASSDQLYNQQMQNFPHIHFDRHVYLPLMVADKRVKISPPGLNTGEKRFVKDLKAYIEGSVDSQDSVQIFLLRNLTRGKGIGFFEANEGGSFYPDFLLWINTGDQQHLLFIDPHGLRHAGGLSDARIRLHERLKSLEKRLAGGNESPAVCLDAFIISPHSYEEVSDSWVGTYTKEELEQKNVLFQDGTLEYITKIFKTCLSD